MLLGLDRLAGLFCVLSLYRVLCYTAEAFAFGRGGGWKEGQAGTIVKALLAIGKVGDSTTRKYRRDGIAEHYLYVCIVCR